VHFVETVEDLQMATVNGSRYLQSFSNRGPTDSIDPHHDRVGELVKVVPVSVAYQHLADEVGLAVTTAASAATFGPSSTRFAPRRWSSGARRCAWGKKRKSTTATWASDEAWANVAPKLARKPPVPLQLVWVATRLGERADGVGREEAKYV
jgi:hypothetical protein